MPEQDESIVLEILRRIRASQDRTESDIGDLMQIQFAGLNQRIDRFDERMGRIERRLEFAAA